MGELFELGAGIPPLAIALAFMIPLAIAVYWYGNRQAGNQFGGGLRRSRWGENDEPLDEAFRAQVRRFQDRDNPGEIADAPPGMVMLRGVLTGADVNLGGAEGRECIWRNRADSPRGTAVAAEIVFFRDGSGQAAIEGLERALVIAPPEKGGRSVEWVGLYLGDEIEVIGRFEPEAEPAEASASADPSARIYGTLGQDGKLHVRLVHRPPRPAADDGDTSPTENQTEPPQVSPDTTSPHAAADPVDPAATSSTEKKDTP